MHRNALVAAVASVATSLALASSTGCIIVKKAPHHGDEGEGEGANAVVAITVEPSDDGAALLNAIKHATSSVHMTMYLLTSHDVENALIERHHSGVDVEVVLNQSFPTAGTDNGDSFDKLASAGVPVKYASSQFTFTHEKCVVIDGKSAWVMTMNATESSPSSNREYLAEVTSDDDVAAAEAIFDADFNGGTPTLNASSLVISPGARPALVDLIGSADKTVDIEAEELADRDVVNAIAAKADEGVPVRIVLPSDAGTETQQSEVGFLKTHPNVKIVGVSNPYIHAKAIVVDDASAYVGSMNFSKTSLDENRELGCIFDDADNAGEIAKISSTIADDFANGFAK